MNISNNKILSFFIKLSFLIKNKILKKYFLKNIYKSIYKDTFLLEKFKINSFIKNKLFFKKASNIKKYKFKKILQNIPFNKNDYYIVFINGFLIKNFINIGSYKLIKNNITNNNILNICKSIKNNQTFLKSLQFLLSKKYTIFIKNIISKCKLQILNINYGNIKNFNLIDNLLNIICLKSKLKILEFYINANNNNNLSIFSKNIILNNSKLEYNCIYNDNFNKNYNFSNYNIYLNNVSKMNNNIFILNKGNTYFSIKSIINNKNSKYIENSLSYAYKNCNFINSYLHYKNSNNSSYHMHKFISNYKGVNTFNGLINVDKYLKNIKGSIYCHGLINNLLSNIFIYPKLKIYTNNIKFNHGTTISYIDYNEMFYLQLRCISYFKSILIIINSFIYKNIKNLNNKNIKLYISNIILKNFKYLKNVSYK